MVFLMRVFWGVRCFVFATSSNFALPPILTIVWSNASIVFFDKGVKEVLTSCFINPCPVGSALQIGSPAQ
ncbi:hypothetical protein D9M71_686190 [compost metagenome]